MHRQCKQLPFANSPCSVYLTRGLQVFDVAENCMLLLLLRSYPNIGSGPVAISSVCTAFKNR